MFLTTSITPVTTYNTAALIITSLLSSAKTIIQSAVAKATIVTLGPSSEPIAAVKCSDNYTVKYLPLSCRRDH